MYEINLLSKILNQLIFLRTAGGLYYKDTCGLFGHIPDSIYRIPDGELWILQLQHYFGTPNKASHQNKLGLPQY